jgi:hypothetical protein
MHIYPGSGDTRAVRLQSSPSRPSLGTCLSEVGSPATHIVPSSHAFEASIAGSFDTFLKKVTWVLIEHGLLRGRVFSSWCRARGQSRLWYFQALGCRRVGPDYPEPAIVPAIHGG